MFGRFGVVVVFVVDDRRDGNHDHDTKFERKYACENCGRRCTRCGIFMHLS